MKLTHIYPVRYDDRQYEALLRASERLGVKGRQAAQREINRLFFGYFGIVRDSTAAAIMSTMISKRERRSHAS